MNVALDVGEACDLDVALDVCENVSRFGRLRSLGPGKTVCRQCALGEYHFGCLRSLCRFGCCFGCFAKMRVALDGCEACALERRYVASARWVNITTLRPGVVGLRSLCRFGCCEACVALDVHEACVALDVALDVCEACVLDVAFGRLRKT